MDTARTEHARDAYERERCLHSRTLLHACLHIYTCPHLAEFTLVHSAFYTEPNDQSAWLYHRWLLGRVVASGADNRLPLLGISLGTHLFDDKQSEVDEKTRRHEQDTEAATATAAPTPAAVTISSISSVARHLAVFTREHVSIDELLSIEPECKWALLTSAILQAGMIACMQRPSEAASTADATATDSKERIGDLTTAIHAIFAQLTELDPMRTNYYAEVRQRLLAEQ
jgi:hypothetical protein